MTISKRLLTIASMVPPCNRIIDVGCDHALLDIYLIINKKITNALAIDIHDSALKQANINIKKIHLNNKINLYLNDGLKGIEILPDDVIVLAGMGCRNIIKILEPSIKKINSIVIQANNEHYELRKWLHKRGFIINNEAYIKEKNKSYIIIVCQKGIAKYNYLDYWLGPILKNNKEYIEYLLYYYNHLVKKIPKRNFIYKLMMKKKTLFLKKKSRSL